MNTETEESLPLMCEECMAYRYRVDAFTGELLGYCGLLEEDASAEDFERLAPSWCKFRN